MFTEGMAAPESEHHVHRATLIDCSASARSFTANSKKSMYEWLTREMDCAEGPSAPLVATITSPHETPTVVIAHTAPIGRISDCLDASEARWLNRQPWQTFVLRHDGTVESYYTPGSCENRNNDHATAHLDVQSVIYPDNPQILLIDIGKRHDVLTILGPGSANMIGANEWLASANGRHNPQLMN